MTPPTLPTGDLSCEEIVDATGAPAANVLASWPQLLRAMKGAGLASLRSQIGMVATVAVETGVTVHGKNMTFLPVLEVASGEAYDTGRLAARLGNTPEDDDDGRRYKGRGFIQTTGLANYRLLEISTELPVVANPDLLLEPGPAATAAVFYWKERKVWRACDLGDWPRVRRLVNGGLTGWDRFIAVVTRLVRRHDPHTTD